jgi:hypothetical protein
MTDQPIPTVLAVDGNSLLHRAFHAAASTMYRTPDGAQGWAVRGLLSQLVAAVDRVCADFVVVGFDDRGRSSRKERWPTYKAQRAPKPESLERQLDLAVQVLRELGVVVVVPEGPEADDVLASVAAQAPALGARTVVATSDRDSFALIDDHTRMLRILNGGVDASPLLDPTRLAMVTGVRPEQYLDLAALRGDTSDNLPGVRRGQRRGAVHRRRRPGADPGPPGARGQGPLAAQPRRHVDGHHRRARPRPGRQGSGPAGRGRRPRDVLPVRAARPLGGPGAHPARADAHRDHALRRPALEGRAAAEAGAAAQDGARAGGPGLRPGDLVLTPCG